MPALLIPTPLKASIDFLDPSLPAQEKPFTWLGTPPEGSPSTNIKSWPEEVEIHDLRETEKEFKVDVNGFQVVEHESACLQDIDSEEGKQKYFKETEELLLRHLPGSTRVKVFNSTIRRKAHSSTLVGGPRTPENTGPVSRAHNDNTPLSGGRRVFAEMGEEAEELSIGRCLIVNVWRPLAYPAQDCPLAAMDYQSLDYEKDLVATDLILGNENGRRGENYSVLHNPSQKWYYMSNQTPSEPIIFKIYESEPEEGRSRLTVHSAFVNREAPKDAKPRQSVEVRCLVFY